MSLVLAGGLLYTAGGLVYALRRPNPFPQVFGYHEIFHVLVVAAVCLQYAVVAFWVVHRIGPIGQTLAGSRRSCYDCAQGWREIRRLGSGPGRGADAPRRRRRRRALAWRRRPSTSRCSGGGQVTHGGGQITLRAGNTACFFSTYPVERLGASSPRTTTGAGRSRLGRRLHGTIHATLHGRSSDADHRGDRELRPVVVAHGTRTLDVSVTGDSAGRRECLRQRHRLRRRATTTCTDVEARRARR